MKPSRVAGSLAFAAALFVAEQGTAAPASDSFSPRLTTPRIPPVDRAHATPAQAGILAAAPDANIFKTLARHPTLFARWSPFGQFILTGSTIQPRHREMAMLRMGWLCQSPYEWAAHARIAKMRAGMTAQEVHAVAEGSGDPAWSDVDRAVLRMTDELRYDGAVSAATWAALHKVYSDQQVLELMVTAGQYQIVSMALNTLGVPFDPGNDERLPRDVTLPAVAGRPARYQGVQRLRPRPLPSLSPQERETVNAWLDPDGSLPPLTATLMAHPRLYALRAGFGGYIERAGQLSPRTRELLIMRTAWNRRSDYVWGRHVPLSKIAGLTEAEIARVARGPAAPGWSPADRAALQAADDLRREAFVSDAAWGELSKSLDDEELMEIVFTVGWFDMMATDVRSLGVPAEPGAPAMPRS